MREEGYEAGGRHFVGLRDLLEQVEALRSRFAAGRVDAALDRLLEQLRLAVESGELAAIDAALVGELLGTGAAAELERLRNLTNELTRAGYMVDRESAPELSPLGLRRIGQRALADLFGAVGRGRLGRHGSREPGDGFEYSDESAPYRFGDAFHLDLEQTVMNAVRRGTFGTPVRLTPGDFVVYRPERGVRCATVLLLDTSRSMLLRGCGAAAKKVALALDALIRGSFPGDVIHLVGFADQARELTTDALARLDYKTSANGTNVQHALAVARTLLDRYRSMRRQIVLVTDGEPTAWLEDGRLRLAYPPTFETLRATLREVGRCTRDDIRINTFMLERSQYLVDFVDRMTRMNRGRAFYTDPASLGEYLLVDFLTNRRKLLA